MFSDYETIKADLMYKTAPHTVSLLQQSGPSFPNYEMQHYEAAGP